MKQDQEQTGNVYVIKPVYDPGEEQKKSAREGEEARKIPVSIVSNSLHIKPVVDRKEDGTIEVSVKGFPGGLARGVNSAFGADSDFQMLRWHATEQQKLNPEGHVDTEVQERINETMRRNSSEFHFLDSETKEAWYEHATNGLYWPFLHELTQYVTEQDRSDVYEQVNHDIADRIVEAIKEEHDGQVPNDAIVWVQDYHFNSSIGYMKDQAPELNVGYFLHVPFPEINAEMQGQLSTHMEAIKSSLKSLLRADSIGFHTEKDKANFVKTLENLGLVNSPEHKKEIEGKILVNPIGIPKDVVKQNYHEAMISQTEQRITFDDNFVQNNPGTGVDQRADAALTDWVGVEGNLSPINILNDKARSWIEGKEEHSRGTMEFSPEKIHIGSVSRTDYTKGIHELIEAFHDFLKEKKEEGIEKPQDLYQLNVVASPPRDMEAFKGYQEEALQKADKLLEDFPGSLNYIPGVGFEELPLFNSAMSVIAATSFRDGYILAVGEALVGKTAAFESKLLPENDIPSGLIVSNGAGIALSLEKNERGEKNVPEALSLVEPTKEAIKEAIATQVGRVETQRNTPLAERDQTLGGFYKLASRLEDTSEFGKKALDPLRAKILKRKIDAGEQLTPKEFNDVPVTRVLATDSDGTIVAANADPKIQVPPAEFVAQMREYSLANPETAVAILSGRADGYLQEHYGAAFAPDEEGRVPKIMLMSENGAFLRTSTDPETLHVLTEPFTPEIKGQIEQITKDAAGEYFRENDQGLDPKEISIWLDPKETTYGIFRRTPVDPEKRAILEGILDKIQEGLKQLEQENPELHINLGAVDAYLVEKVSKGITMEELMSDKLDSSLQKAGMNVGPVTAVSYAGDDVADIVAQNAVNEALANGSLTEGYTSRINDYAPDFSPSEEVLMSRTPPKSPKDPAAQDSFYLVGDKDVSGQDQHRSLILDNDAFTKMNGLRESLSERGLLPSQSGSAETPPIVLLATGDILIQEPERYPKEAIAKLQDWSQGKVVLMANEGNASEENLKALVGDNINLVAVTTEGSVYTQGRLQDKQTNLTEAKEGNKIISSDAQRSSDIQQLRAIQEVLIASNILQEKSQKPAARVEAQPAAAQQEEAVGLPMDVMEEQTTTSFAAALGVVPAAPVAAPVAAVTEAPSAVAQAPAQAPQAPAQASQAVAQAPQASAQGLGRLAALPYDGPARRTRGQQKRARQESQEEGQSSRRQRTARR